MRAPDFEPGRCRGAYGRIELQGSANNECREETVCGPLVTSRPRGTRPSEATNATGTITRVGDAALRDSHITVSAKSGTVHSRPRASSGVEIQRGVPARVVDRPVGVGHVAEQLRRIVRASGEVLHVPGRLNIGRHIHARADERTADAEWTAEDGGVTESPQMPIESDAVHEQRMGSEHQGGSESFQPVEAVLHAYGGRHRVAPDSRSDRRG